MRLDRKTILTCVVCLVLWSWATGTGGSSAFDPVPCANAPWPNATINPASNTLRIQRLTIAFLMVQT